MKTISVWPLKKVQFLSKWDGPVRSVEIVVLARSVKLVRWLSYPTPSVGVVAVLHVKFVVCSCWKREPALLPLAPLK